MRRILLIIAVLFLFIGCSTKNNFEDSEELLQSIQTERQNIPTALTKKFIKAYLDGDEKTMLSITSRYNINRLRSIDAKVKEAFKGVISYNERIYMHGLKAAVFVKTKVPIGVVNIDFEYKWLHGRWVLTEVI